MMEVKEVSGLFKGVDYIRHRLMLKFYQIEKNRNLNDTKYQLHKIWLFRYYHQSTYQ